MKLEILSAREQVADAGQQATVKAFLIHTAVGVKFAIRQLTGAERTAALFQGEHTHADMFDAAHDEFLGAGKITNRNQTYRFDSPSAKDKYGRDTPLPGIDPQELLDELREAVTQLLANL